jgi:DNA-binding response OmpR family regulator
MNRLLLVEDDLSLIDGLEYTLEKNGYGTDVARTMR